MRGAADRFRRWDLTPDGPEIVTPRARLFPVRHAGAPAILKRATVAGDEAEAARVLAHFAGHGGVRVLEADDGDLLLERAVPGTPLSDLVADGRDDEATAVIADTIARLHHDEPPPGFPTVEDWADGFRRQRSRGSHPFLPPAMLDRAETGFHDLAASQGRRYLLHGDLHHDNILQSGDAWLVIDPKGVVGEVAFETAVMLRNPMRLYPVAADPGTMARRVAMLGERLSLDRDRILGWAYAVSVLSACWHIEDGGPGSDVARSLAVADVAASLLS